MLLWTLKDIAAALGIAAPAGTESTPVHGISIDTRTLEKGDLFVALSGTPGGGFKSSFASTGDGHAWLQLAAEKGAAAAIVSTPNPAINIPQLVVNETHMEGLWKLGEAARARFEGKVIALTGSAGKSTTKEFLGGMLNEVGIAYASIGSYNNFWGVPLTLARTPKELDFAVLEMGMNQPGELAKLAILGKPDVALVVNVRPVHLENIGSLDGIRKEKLGVVQGLVAGGTLVIPAELSLDGVDMSGVGRVVRFVPEKVDGADVYVLNHHAHGTDWHVVAQVGNDEVEFTLANGAPHRLWNALAALATCYALDVDVQKASAALATAGTMAGRGAETVVNGITVLDDAFNGNPASMAASLQALKARPTSGKKIAVLGDMLELGDAAPGYHAGLAPECAGLDGVVCVGPLMKNLYDALPQNLRLFYQPDPAALQPQDITSLLHAGDTVVVKGSKKIFFVRQFVPKLIEALKA